VSELQETAPRDAVSLALLIDTMAMPAAWSPDTMEVLSVDERSPPALGPPHTYGPCTAPSGPIIRLAMWCTCIYVPHMAKMIQLRNVPDELHRLLKARAALEGLSLSEYLLAEIRRSAERPPLPELRERLHQRTPVVPDVSPAEILRELRDQL
jgi:hypothetical protein